MEPDSALIQPDKEGYAYQVKWDGVRLLAFGYNGSVRFQSRNLRDKSGHYPELETLPAQVRTRDYIFDGELIALREGRPSFYRLMQRVSAGKNRAAALSREIPVFYMIFDLLFLAGNWVTEEPWEARQELLRQALEEREPFHLTPTYPEGMPLLQVVNHYQLEGMVAKKLGSPYVFGPRKTKNWLKMKAEQRLKAVVGGITIKEGHLASLLLGLEGGNGALQYIGKVSAGLGEKERQVWHQWALDHRLMVCPFDPAPKESTREFFVWVKPENAVQVSFSEWTPALRLRAPRLHGKKYPG